MGYMAYRVDYIRIWGRFGHLEIWGFEVLREGIYMDFELVGFKDLGI